MTKADGVTGTSLSGRFAASVLIRQRGLVTLHAAHDRERAQEVVLVSASEGADREAASRVLRRMAAQHEQLDHPLVPQVAALQRVGDREVLIWDCDGRFDMQHLVDRMATRPEERLPYAAAIGFTDTLLSVLAHAHQRRDRDDAPICIGGLCWGDILVAREGHWWVTGFGRNSVPSPGVVYAPEVAAGGPCSPGADLFALQQLLHASMPAVNVPAVMREAFLGRGDNGIIQWFQLVRDSILADDPSARPASAGAIRPLYEAHWRRMGVWPDGQQMRNFVRERLGDRVQEARPPEAKASAAAAEPANEATTVVRRDGDWFVSADGRKVVLERRRALRAILALLARHAGTPQSLAALQRAGWPGQRLAVSSGRNRTYVAISTLRGLGAPIRRRGEGYLLPPEVHIQPS